MKSSGRASWLGVLSLLVFLGACTDPVVNLEEPAEVETCQWLIPVGIELVNDYVYTLLETDLGATGGDPASLPTSLIALNSRGEELDTRAAELDCDLDLLNEAIVEATSGIESEDVVVQTFLETVRGGVVGGMTLDGDWTFSAGVADGAALRTPNQNPVILVVDGNSGSGNTGCNQYFFDLVAGDGHWETPDIMSTAAGCPGDGETAAHSAYVRALAAVDSYVLEADSLVLTGPDVEIRYTSNQAGSAGG